jgi:hypothetical protein
VEASILVQQVVIGNHSLIATYYVNQLFSSFYKCNKSSMTLGTRMHQFHFYKEIRTTIAYISIRQLKLISIFFIGVAL